VERAPARYQGRAVEASRRGLNRRD
jgi:hypothetical protein